MPLQLRALATPAAAAMLSVLLLSAGALAVDDLAERGAIRIVAVVAFGLASAGLALLAVRHRPPTPQRSEAILRDALDHMPHGVLVTDREGSLVLLNEAFRGRHPDMTVAAGGTVGGGCGW